MTNPATPVLTMKLEAPTMGVLLDAIEMIARQVDDADRFAELDVAPRPVDPRWLH